VKKNIFLKVITVGTILALSSMPLHSKWFRRKKESKIKQNEPVAHIRFGNQLHSDEVEFLNNRRPIVKAVVEKITGLASEKNDIPTISVVCSGGGYRAMLGSIGAWSGLEQIGVFDAVTYISSLSGSTWALGLLMSMRVTISQLKKYISQQLLADFYEIHRADARLIGRMLFDKLSSSQSFTSVDLFGGLLANHLLKGYFGKNCQRVHLSDQGEYIKKGNVPFPIYTAIDGRMGAVANPAWYEFTPFEIGSAEYAAYVPTWAFGQRCNNGVSLKNVPEQSLGFLFGIFGSAFGAHVGLAWDRVLKELTPSFMKSSIEKFLIKSKIAQVRFAWARVHNFMFGIEDCELKKLKNLKLVDGGIACNLPYLPVSGQRSERAPDILIFFDFSRSRVPDSLQKSEAYAREKNLKFPVIDYTDIEKRVISIFKDENDPEVPVVIYMPRISDHQLWDEKKQYARYKKYRIIEGFDFSECAESGPCTTLNFTYSLRASRQVMDQMEFNVVACEDAIIDTIKWVMERKPSSAKAYDFAEASTDATAD
jgi:cytosolic phospholipase A2